MGNNPTVPCRSGNTGDDFGLEGLGALRWPPAALTGGWLLGGGGGSQAEGNLIFP